MNKFDQLREVTRRALDEKEGCEWVKSKTLQDIGSYTLEEVYELLDALENRTHADVKDELADLAFHLVLYAEMAEKQGAFTLEDVLDCALDKQYHRRLSLTQSEAVATAEEAHAHWKAQKRHAREEESMLGEIPKNMPALVRSQKIQDRAGDVGFDWDNAREVLNKIKEEMSELEAELKDANPIRLLDELGDILFSIVNLARHLNLDSEQSLRHANTKFIRRFHGVETLLKQQEQSFESLDFNALLEVWEAVKRSEKNN